MRQAHNIYDTHYTDKHKPKQHTNKLVTIITDAASKFNV